MYTVFSNPVRVVAKVKLGSNQQEYRIFVSFPRFCQKLLRVISSRHPVKAEPFHTFVITFVNVFLLMSEKHTSTTWVPVAAFTTLRNIP